VVSPSNHERHLPEPHPSFPEADVALLADDKFVGGVDPCVCPDYVLGAGRGVSRWVIVHHHISLLLPGLVALV
jgi:hypothetical protein